MICERYLIEKTEENCHKCRQNPSFRKDLSEKRQILDPKNCKYRQTVDKRHCYCSLFEQTRDISLCQICEKKRVFNISCQSHGIGDVLTGLYACAGVREKYPDSKIRYFSRYPQWTSIYKEIESIGQKDTCAVQNFIEIFHDYSGELRSEMTRKEWYSKLLCVSPAIPKIKKIDAKPIFAGDYVCLAPFSAWKNRSWNVGAWLYLECLIRERLGFQTVILDGPGDGSRTGCFQGFRLWGYPPETVINIAVHAKCIVANDSMIAHLGGLLDVKTIAILAQISAKKIFSQTNVVPIVGDLPCISCNFQHERGYRNGCDHECFALNAISPFRVFEKIREIVS